MKMNKHDLNLIKQILAAKIEANKARKNSVAVICYSNALEMIKQAQAGNTKKLEQWLKDTLN